MEDLRKAKEVLDFRVGELEEARMPQVTLVMEGVQEIKTAMEIVIVYFRLMILLPHPVKMNCLLILSPPAPPAIKKNTPSSLN